MYTIHPLDSETRERVIKRIVKENGFSERLATSILDETLVYLHATQHTDLSLGPSGLVDIGWHTFILYTREYAKYCETAFGHFVHHCPTDREGEVGLPLSETIKFFEENGIAFDPELWELSTQCVGQGGGGNCGTQQRELVAAQTLAGCTERCSTNCK